MRHVNKIILLVLCVLAAGCSNTRSTQPVTSSTQQPSNTALKMLEQKLPSFVTLDTNENEIVSQEYQAKPMLIMFWASWCPHCQRQMPIINRLYQRYHLQVNFFLLNLVDGVEETKASGLSYLEQQQFAFPYYEDRGEKIADDFQVDTIPTIYLVNRNQEIKRVVVDFMDEEAIAQLLEELE